MLALVAAWFHLGWLALAFGFLGEEVFQLFSRERSDAQRVRDLGLDRVLLLGFLLITGLTAFISMFHAIDAWVNGAFVLAGLGLTYRYAGSMRSEWRKLGAGWRRASVPLKVLFVVVLVMATVGYLGSEISEVDAKLYHIPSMLWIKDYAVVPGLGNLHGRLAFNSHYFLSAALFSVEFSEDRLLLPVFSFFYAVTLVRLAVNTDRYRRERDLLHFALHGLIFVFFMAQMLEYLNAISTDYIVTLLAFHVFLLVLEKHPEKRQEVLFYWIAFVLIAAVTIKLSAMFLFAVLPFYLLPLHRRKYAFLLGVGAFLLLPFFYRNYILSGYLVYPLAQIDLFDPDWKVPKDLTLVERDYIEAYAKIPEWKLVGRPRQEALVVSIYQNEAKENYQWLGIWWMENLPLRHKPLLLLNALSFLFIIWAFRRREQGVALVLLTSFVYLVLWFFSAPAPRFAFGVIFFNAALVLSLLLQRYWPKRLVPYGSWVFLPLAGLTLLVLVKHPKYYKHPFGWESSYFLLPRTHENPAVEAVKGLNFTYYTPPNIRKTTWGLECYSSPEPCTPYPKAGLMMRGEDLQDGFRIREP